MNMNGMSCEAGPQRSEPRRGFRLARPRARSGNLKGLCTRPLKLHLRITSVQILQNHCIDSDIVRQLHCYSGISSVGGIAQLPVR